jgi:hypothetical protein
MRHTADVTGGKPIAVLLQSISGVSAINPLVNNSKYEDIANKTLLDYTLSIVIRGGLR